MHLSGWDGIGALKVLLKEKGIVKRERTPIEVMLFAVYDYLRGASLRRVRDGLSTARSHVAVGNWVKRFGSVVKGGIGLVNGTLPDVLVVDETEIQVGSDTLYLWVALDPERRAVWYVALSDLRNLLVAKSFFRAIKKTYGRYPKKVITDGGVWYPWALKRLGIEHEMMKGGVRSYIERWNETLKDRARSFDKYHPCNKPGCDRKHIIHWIAANVFFYNHVRPHMSLSNNPPILKKDWYKLSNRMIFLKRFMEALS